MSTEFRWLTVEGHRMSFIETAANAETIACQLRGDGFAVLIEPAPDPEAIPHGERYHRCHDGDAACLAAARDRGRAEFYRRLACRAGQIQHDRVKGQERINDACGCDRCAERLAPQEG